MYQALYRKYRPNTFDEVVGQKIVIQTLKNAIKNNKLSHAYLFAGPRGTGKTSIAKILAKTINCTNLKGTNPCNKCVNCTQCNNKQMIDIIEIDAASNNGVDEIRELKSKVNLVPNTGKYKIYIIDEVHMLTTGAFNALLKTLEEPPSHIVFVLATTEPQKIPATILSRCQRFDFKKIPDQLILDHLKQVTKKEKIKITDDAITEIARLADGGMRDALSMLDQVSSFTEDKITVSEVHEVNGTLEQSKIKKFVEYLLESDVANVLKIIDQYNHDGKNLAKLIEEIMLFLKNLLLYKQAPTYFKENNSNFEIYDMSIDDNYIINCIEVFNESLNIMKKTINQKIILETTVIKLINMNNVSDTQNNNLEKKSEIFKQGDLKTLINKNSNNKKELKKKENSKIEDNETLNIKKEIENVILESVNNEIKEKLKNIKKIRINNALSDFNKKKLIEFKEKLEDVRNLILDPEYNYEASMLLDGKLKAIGNDYLIFVYDTEHISDLFNEKILNIEKMLKNIYHKEYKVISTYLEEWNIIKKEFNNKEKEFIFIEDNINLDEIFKNNNEEEEKNDIEQLFDDIVEYN